MKPRSYSCHILFFVIFTFIIWRLTPADAQQVRINSQTGKVGETVTFTVSLHEASRTIDALGLILAYDPQVLRYTGTFTQGQLVAGFDYVDVYEPQTGRIHVGAFTTQKAIPKGGAGDLANLTFTVLTANDSTVQIVRAVDDLGELQTGAGKFSRQ